jgi:hypothetical protein
VETDNKASAEYAGPKPANHGLLAPGETSGEGFLVMVAPTLGCSIQADVKLKNSGRKALL